MRAWSVIGISFATSAITAAATAYVVQKYDIVSRQANTDESVVPSLVGMSEADARRTAAAARLTLTVSGHEPRADAKVDTVLYQSLPAGQKTPRQQPVSVVLAEAQPKVPTLIGLSLDAGTARLKEAGYTVFVAGSVPNATIAEGQIAAQNPEADAAYVKGGRVTVQLSAGPAEVEVPKLVGTNYTKAKTDVEALGLKLLVAWVDQGETPEYLILNQNPAPGTKLKPGSEVRLTVNR